MKILIEGIFKRKDIKNHPEDYTKVALTKKEKDEVERALIEVLNKRRYFGNSRRVR